jgi:alcohol dehydrogenase class IV
MEQTILTASDKYEELDRYLRDLGASSILLVCDISLPFLRLNGYIDCIESRLGIRVVKFNDFQPNPRYESVVRGVETFHKNSCDTIIAVGGGSAIDVAKCVKLSAAMDSSVNYLKQSVIPNDIHLMAIPTTAGTGSEATRYAVIYYNGEKQSVTDESMIPSAVLMDASALKFLPEYQKKSTMMDTFCHAIESCWSVNSTEESRKYSHDAIRLVLENKDSYMANEEKGNTNMLWAANTAGKAINITQTTAGHALCYKLTGLYGIAHGHAAALCVSKLWPYMLANTEKCIDPRGIKYLNRVFLEISEAMSCKTNEQAIACFSEIIDSLKLTAPEMKDTADFDVLAHSVNSVRLKNNPVALNEKSITEIYRAIFKKD